MIRVAQPLTFVTLSPIFVERGLSAQLSIGTNGGAGAVTVQMIGGTAPPGMHVDGNTISGTPTTVGTYTVTFRAQDSYVGGPQTITQDFDIVVREKPPVIVTKEMPKAIVGRPYDFSFAVDGGTRPFNWTSQFPIPGLTFNTAAGRFTGTPTVADRYAVVVDVHDSSTPPRDNQLYLVLTVDAAPRGRNDSIATATSIHSGMFVASISPYVNAGGNEAPDTDFYVATANGDAQVTVRVDQPPDFRSPAGLLDPVIEIVNAAGQRLTTCRNLGTSDGLGLTEDPDPTPDAFDDPCINDDIELGANINSQLELKIPPGAPVTFYIHVLDFRGDARPDMRYVMNVSGVN
jgi:hypothetical protein